MVMTPEQSAKLKEVQFEMLKVFAEICEKEKLTYWLIAGTALGAVRHKGFIPWDDDIDVGMPRADYERFMEIGQSYLPEYYFLQNYKTDPNYPINFAKIRDSRTTYIESSAAHLDMNHGVWIDIFPHDGFPKKGMGAKLNKFFEKTAVARIGKAFILPRGRKSLKARAVDIMGYILYPTVSCAIKHREKRFKKYPFAESEFVRNYSGAWGDAKEVMKREILDGTSEGVFEGLKINLPLDWDKYLSSLYRDYMTPPPEDKRVGHHDAVVVDCEKPYTEYAECWGKK